MIDYRKLSQFHKDRIDKTIISEIEPKHKINQFNGFEYDEPQYTLDRVHSGHACAECWCVYYNCLCNQD